MVRGGGFLPVRKARPETKGLAWKETMHRVNFDLWRLSFLLYFMNFGVSAFLAGYPLVLEFNGPLKRTFNSPLPWVFLINIVPLVVYRIYAWWHHEHEALKCLRTEVFIIWLFFLALLTVIEGVNDYYLFSKEQMETILKVVIVFTLLTTFGLMRNAHRIGRRSWWTPVFVFPVSGNLFGAFFFPWNRFVTMMDRKIKEALERIERFFDKVASGVD